jgi:riboflavin kinase / FMN adenylyltransferase
MMVLDGPWREWTGVDGPASVTIGVLDGVHRGHRALLAGLDTAMTRTVLTFDPHPVEVLRPGTLPRLLTTISERLALFEEAGMGCVGVLDLTEIKDLTPSEFVEQVLAGKLNTGQLVVGRDFRFGKDRTGDVALLERLGPDHDFKVETIDLVVDGDSPVSSSRIRALIEEGAVDTAASLAGQRFTVTNTVVDGDKRGRDIGFPTANILPPERKVVPGTGVYACIATVGGNRHDAAVSVGVRPTFGGGELVIEAFILDFDRDIYGEEMTIEFVKQMRPELRFDSVDELVFQMRKDVEVSRAILEASRM